MKSATQSRSRDIEKNRSSSSSARLPPTKRPSCPPTAVSIDSSSSSGCRISRLKNSITPRTSAPRRMGNPNAACSPTRAATGPRGKFESVVTSGIQAGCRLAHTRPGSPTPRVEPRLLAEGGELVELQRLVVPGRRGVERRRLAAHHPQPSILPVQGLADGLQHSRRRFDDGGGFAPAHRRCRTRGATAGVRDVRSPRRSGDASLPHRCRKPAGFHDASHRIIYARRRIRSTWRRCDEPHSPEQRPRPCRRR